MLIAQMTDLHIVARGALAYGMIDTNTLLSAAIDRLNTLAPLPDLVIVTGDLTDHGTAEEYALVRAELDRLRAPAIVLTGNHDERDMLRAGLAGYGDFPATGFLHYVHESRPIRVIALDSTLDDSHKAAFDGDRAAWLDARLAEAPDVPTLVAVHHPPFDTGIAWMDGEGAGWAAPLVEVLARHPQIVRVISGHMHRAITAEAGGRVATVSPSVAHQVALDLVPGISAERPPLFEMEPPAFQLHRWDGVRLVTHTVTVGRWPLMPLFSSEAFAAYLESRNDSKMQF